MGDALDVLADEDMVVDGFGWGSLVPAVSISPTVGDDGALKDGYVVPDDCVVI
ncbi:MAG: hypothetical protein QF371_09280 [Flavobacteriales bacterium]|nr:hypothetical protein [Flavobacteriales bacterium]